MVIVDLSRMEGKKGNSAQIITKWITLRLLQMCDVYIRPKIITPLIAPFVWISFAFSTIKGQNYIEDTLR